jgi:3-dehydroquinate synthase
MKNPIFMQGDLKAKLELQLKRLKPSSVFCFADRRAMTAIPRDVDAFWVPTENKKSFAEVEKLHRRMLRAGLDRHSVMVAIGGGITTDLGGFAAATFLRGIRWIAVPTTLLGMADAAIGGKTAVNLPEGKNLAGAFHLPTAVLADIRTLRTLPDREWSCGLGEVIKSGMIGSPSILNTLATAPKAALRRPGATTLALAKAAAMVKTKIVQMDPLEKGERKLLNLGHTFGHALETAAGQTKLRHGEAVGLGILCSLRLAVENGLCDPAWAEHIRKILLRASLPTQFPGALPSTGLLKKLLLRDKKARSGKLDLVLPIKAGTCLRVEGVDAKEVVATIRREFTT